MKILRVIPDGILLDNELISTNISSLTGFLIPVMLYAFCIKLFNGGLTGLWCVCWTVSIDMDVLRTIGHGN
jgi:hypothetical protein